MLDWFIHFFKGPNLFHPKVWKGRLQPTNFRLLVPADIPQCLEIYELNRPGRFPDGVEAQYRPLLGTGKNCTLVAERDGRIVATGGIEKFVRHDVVFLSFGLVHPASQGCGLGIALTMARLALLEPTPDNYHVFIAAVQKSIDYYGRLGFRVIGAWPDAQGETHPFAHLLVSAKDIHGCGKLLKQHARFLAVFSGMAALDVRVRLALAAHLDSGLKARDVKAWGGASQRAKPQVNRPESGSSLNGRNKVSPFQGWRIFRTGNLGLRRSERLQPRLSHRGLSALSPGELPEPV